MQIPWSLSLLTTSGHFAAGKDIKMIGIINYKAGNAPSVFYALEKLGIDGKMVSTTDEIAGCSRIILPGVGSAKATMESLDELGCLDVLTKKVLDEKTPFLGICIGLQVLFEHSEEEDTECLGWIKGNVKRFSQEGLRIPHIGWNQVNFQKEHPVLAGIGNDNFFYFVNSYHCVPADPNVALGITEYGYPFCSIVISSNIMATQFHTEKSGTVGLQLLKNFATINPEVFLAS